jgi:glycerol kinase
MQFQSDVLGIEIVRPALVETTALGAALLAGISAGVWRDTGDAARAWKEERRFTPKMARADVEAHKARWQRALERA